MNCIQATAFWSQINAKNVNHLCGLPSLPHVFSLVCYQHPVNVTKLKKDGLRYRSCTPVAVFGDEGKSRNGGQDPPWKVFEKVLGNFGKRQSVEDVLKQQIEKQEYSDGSGSGGSGGGVGSGGGSPGGSEDEGSAGVLDETVQVILATIGFIFMYIYIINGEEMARLAKDYIKYLFGGQKSVRLRRAMYQWGRIYRRIMTQKKKEVDKYWLERAILNTPTWWDHPEKYRRLLRAYMEYESRSHEYE